MMLNSNILHNDVNRSGLLQEGPSFGRCSAGQQSEPSHHQNTANVTRRKKWTSLENRIVMECHKSNQSKLLDYRKRILEFN